MQTEPSTDRSTDIAREHSTSVKDSSQATDRKHGLQEQLREEIAKHLTGRLHTHHVGSARS